MAQAPHPKRSIFSKQAFSKVNVAKDPVDFFSCAKKVYPQLLEEEEQKREIKIRSRETQRSKNTQESEEIIGEKKPIISPSKGFTNLFNNDNSPPRSSLSLSQEHSTFGSPSTDENEGSPQFLVQSTPITSNKKRKLVSLDIKSKPIVSLDSDDEETDQNKSDPFNDDNVSTFDPFQNDITKPQSFQSPFVEAQLDKADEYSEFIQEAREREKMKAQKYLIASSFTEKNLRTSEEKNSDIFESEAKSIIEIDPTVELLITSELEGTRPLRVKRKLSQRLKEARLTWCEKQNIRTDKLGRPLEEVIFFTWRGKRLFDVTTCGALGPKFSKEGKLLPDKHGTDSNGNIHLEAWTEDALRCKEEKAMESKELENEGSRNEREHNSDKDNGRTFKLILKAKDLEPCKLVVRPTTTIWKMAEAFRKAKAIPESTKISLHFDGDLLDPKSMIEETELGDSDDIDTVEVYLKG